MLPRLSAGRATSKQIFTLDTGSVLTRQPFVDNRLLDYLTSSGGSGKGDGVPLPDALFANSGRAEPYVYLYSQFGCGGGNKNCNNNANLRSDDISQAGFEEWWVRSVISGGGGW
jgi:hypothetical protein